MEKISNDFCITLKKERQKRKLTQKEVAKMLDITPSAYARKERNEREFKYKELLILCRYFGLFIW